MNSKRLVLILTFSLPLFCFGQNWNLVKMNQKYHYMHDTSDVVYTIWVDSIQENSLDTTFFLNLVMKKCDTCTTMTTPWGCEPVFYLVNQPQFFGNAIIRDSLGYILRDSYDRRIVMDQQSTTGWVFDSLGSILAISDSLVADQTFGCADSLLIIALSGNDTLIISKDFGILKYPDGTGGYYTMIGCEDTARYGTVVPDVESFYSIHAGDVYCYFVKYFNQIEQFEIVFKYEVNRRYTNTGSHTDSIVGVANGFVNVYYQWGSFGFLHMGSNINQPSHDVFTFYHYPVASKYTGEICESIANQSSDFSITEVRYTNGTFFRETLDPNGYEIVPGYDSVYARRQQFPDWRDNNYVVIQDSVGDLINIEMGSEYWYEWRLLWYTKQGDTTFVTERKPVEMASGPALWPNPARDYFRINNHESVEEIFVTDLWGRRRLSFSGNFSQPLNISPLEPGMYIIFIRELNGKSITRKLIKSNR